MSGVRRGLGIQARAEGDDEIGILDGVVRCPVAVGAEAPEHEGVVGVHEVDRPPGTGHGDARTARQGARTYGMRPNPGPPDKDRPAGLTQGRNYAGDVWGQ